MEWLAEINHNRGLTVLAFWGLLASCTAWLALGSDLLSLGVPGPNETDRAKPWLITHLALGVADLSLASAARLVKLRATTFEKLLCVMHILQVACSAWTIGSHAQFVMFSRWGFPFLLVSVAFTGVRARYFIGCMLIDVVNLTTCTLGRSETHVPSALYAVGLLFSGVILYSQHTQWRAIYEVQQELAAEKEASEALVSMICDAACWIAADGDTVSSGDPRLDTIMGGLRMQGQSLGSYMPQDERDRLRQATGRMRDPALRIPSVTLLPVTLLPPCTGPIEADLLIVDRRMAFAAPGEAVDPIRSRVVQPGDVRHRRGFLVGFRLSNPIHVDSGLISPSSVYSDTEQAGITSHAGLAACALDLEDGHSDDSVVEASIPDTLLSAKLPAPLMHVCSRAELEAALLHGAGHLSLLRVACPQRRETILAAIKLVFESARGGALVCVADAKDFRQVFKEGLDDSGKPGPAIRVCDGGYMTDRLRGMHIKDAQFALAFQDFTEHSDTDCWPSDFCDQAARGLPKDGAFLIASSGYRVKCAAKLLGLPPPGCWENRGTKHEAALACAAAVRDCYVLVRSECGSIHMVVREGGVLHAYTVEPGV